MSYEESRDGTDPNSAYGYPNSVKGSDVARFLETIGVNPVDLPTLRSVRIDPDGVTIERFRVMRGIDDKYHVYVTGRGNGADVAMQVTTCRIAWSE